MTRTVAEVLEKAADHIEQVGLYKGDLVDNEAAAGGVPLAECRVCSYGSILFAATGDPTGETVEGKSAAWAAHDALLDHLGELRIGPWNDAPNRTQAEVVAAFRAAASKARES